MLAGADGVVEVQVSDGIVTIGGVVQNASLVEQIEAEVKGTEGVLNVVSALSAE